MAASTTQRILIGHVQGDQGDPGPGYGGASTTSLSIGTGARTLTVTPPGLAYAVGARIRVANSATNWMEGQITAYNAATGALTFTSDLVGGSGTLASWTLSLAGARGAQGLGGTVSLGTTTTLAPGSQATVSQSGTPEARVLSFGIPQGVGGPDSAVPALEMTLQGPSIADRYVQLRLTSGMIQAGDRIVILRFSRSGSGSGMRSRLRETWNNNLGIMMPPRWQHNRGGGSGLGGQWERRNGFRYPWSDMGYGGQGNNLAVIHGTRPNWGNFENQVWGSNLASENRRTRSWTPNFYHTAIGAVTTAPAVMDIHIPWREMMRYKPLHRRRGTELIKFAIMRPDAGYYPGGRGRDRRDVRILGICKQTIVVRLHQHTAIGNPNRIVSVTVRP